MRTIYLGDSYQRNLGQNATYNHRVEPNEPQGDDMPVFDRYASGGRDEYERPFRNDEDRVYSQRITRGQMWARTR